nr:hypothetical protein [Cellulomonas bogoriensis]
MPVAVWRARQEQHAARADDLTAGHRARRASGRRHPVEDFLYDYYGTTPATVRRWHPGVGVGLEAPTDDTTEHLGRRWYTRTSQVVHLDTQAFLADRGDTVRYVHHLLTATASRPAATGCFGLHEWAMVYRQPASERRHALPLRLGPDGTDAVVEEHQVRCTHYDAFRFFTPQATGRNRWQPTRRTQPDLEQPGCLHANMDLWKWASKLGPAVPGELALDCFALAAEVRRLDMQASPYDVSSLGEPAVAIETPEGKAEYVARQRELAERASVLRAGLIEVCEALLDGSVPPSAR